MALCAALWTNPEDESGGIFVRFFFSGGPPVAVVHALVLPVSADGGGGRFGARCKVVVVGDACLLVACA